ncbi:MAG: hypothetical protein M0006_03710 [Magnetospirillum sp.]|nr:hypothetical protein [Magnetospirillum sp.]
METLAFSLTEDLRIRLETLAAATNRPLDDCLRLAVREFVETWERHLDDVSQIDPDEVRAVLRAAVE